MAEIARAVRWETTGGELQALVERRGVRLYVAMLAVLSLLGWAVPLTDHVGYELSELIALGAGAFGVAVGVGAARRARPIGGLIASARGLGAAVLISQLALLVPLTLTLLDAVRRPVCEPLSGLAMFALLACPSALLSCVVGFLCTQLEPKLTAALLWPIFLGTLAFSLWPLWHGPQVFVFHHLGGMYPGPIYDQAIGVTPALIAFRETTLVYALAGAALALLLAPRLANETLAPRVVLGLIALVAGWSAISLSRRGEELHFDSSVAQIDAVLGARIETAHLVLHVPKEKSELERKLLARDAEASVDEVLEFFDAPGTAHPRIDVFLYRSSEEKRRLIGAADTSFTKPWLRQIHTNDGPAPHRILRHELAHALGADFTTGPFGVPGRLGGLLPDMAFIEGLAVAADWPVQEGTIDEEAAALKQLGKLPDLPSLFAPGHFYGEAGPNAYAAAGSFVRYVWRERGGAAMRTAYGQPQGFASFGEVAVLAAGYLKYLDTIAVPPRVLALAQLQFSAPAIIRQRCAHEVAELQHEAEQAASSGDSAHSVELWTSCVSLEPDDPALLIQERRALLNQGLGDKAHAVEAEILAHPKLSQPQRAQLLSELGDAAWRTDDTTLAAQQYAEAAALPQPEAQSRALEARQYAMAERARWAATRRLLAGNDAGAETWLLLRDLDVARPQEGFAAYLLAKQAQNIGAWDSCLRFSASALTRELPGPLFVTEALRMRALCGWRGGDDGAARRALEQLARDPSEARHLEATRMLRRTP